MTLQARINRPQPSQARFGMAAAAAGPAAVSLTPSSSYADDAFFEGSDQGKLRAAFEYFNQMSQQLTEAYQSLEQQVRDLSQQLQEAEQRREHEVAAKERVAGRLEGLLNVLPVGVVLLDVRGHVQDCNPAAVTFLGEPLIGARWLDVIHRAFAPRLDDGHEVSLRDGRRVSIATRSLEIEPGQLIVLTDMTQTRELQERLSHHQRLSALGKMVASLAHQIRTPLSAALLYAEHLTQDNLPPGQQQRFADKLLSRLNHLEHQVRDMLVFARNEVALADRISVEQLLESAEQAMEAPLAQSESQLELINWAPGTRLQCNQEALVGAILNLVNNAIQAAGRDAQICIQVEPLPGAQVQISVNDNGPGMEQETLARLATPFFTTKPQGTGLGLAVVQAVVRAHQGDMQIESTPGQGTSVKLRLPTLAHDIAHDMADDLAHDLAQDLDLAQAQENPERTA